LGDCYGVDIILNFNCAPRKSPIRTYFGLLAIFSKGSESVKNAGNHVMAFRFANQILQHRSFQVSQNHLLFYGRESLKVNIAFYQTGTA